MKRNSSAAFTLIELLVVIAIIAVLASIAVPVFSGVQTRGAQTKALSNGKQIALAMKLYSMDNEGRYPNTTLSGGKPSTTLVTDSNTAFAQLIPEHVPSESIFAVGKSAFTPTQPDEQYENPPADTPVKTLAAGENHWALVLGIQEGSDPRFPLIADGFNDAAAHKYSKIDSDKGGVWRGKNAIVIFADSSGKVMKVDSTSLTIKSSPKGGDLFDTAETDWMSAANKVVNPK
jgi:prepilin-type N-terminal cleavage/methylation domain-containing protein